MVETERESGKGANAAEAARAAQDRAAEAARDVQGRAADVAGSAGGKVAGLAQEAQDRTSDLAGRAGDRAAEVVNRAREGASELGAVIQDRMGPAKEQASDALEAAAGKAWEAAHMLRKADQHWLSQMLGLGAEELSGMADRVRENDLKGLLDRFQAVARRQPAVFAGASVAAGFVLARMARLAMEKSPASGSGSPPASGSEPTDTTQTVSRPEVPPARSYPGATYDE